MCPVRTDGCGQQVSDTWSMCRVGSDRAGVVRGETGSEFRDSGTHYLAIDRFQLLQCGQHKDGRLAHPGLRLTQHVHGQNGLRDAFMLHCKKTEAGNDTHRYDRSFESVSGRVHISNASRDTVGCHRT